MARGTCVDCDRTVEVTEHGTCASCGSSSIVKIQYNKTIGIINPAISINDVLEAVEGLMVKIGTEEASAAEQAAMQFISARLARMSGLTLGQYLENVLSIWQMCGEVEKVEVSDEKGN